MSYPLPSQTRAHRLHRNQLKLRHVTAILALVVVNVVNGIMMVILTVITSAPFVVRLTIYPMRNAGIVVLMEHVVIFIIIIMAVWLNPMVLIFVVVRDLVLIKNN
jgi:hypothetical protein